MTEGAVGYICFELTVLPFILLYNIYVFLYIYIGHYKDELVAGYIHV